jgi:dipeptidase D
VAPPYDAAPPDKEDDVSFVATLEPAALWRHFDRILEIPRASKAEAAMREFVIGVADGRGLEHRSDPAGNLVVRKPASTGREDAPITVLQSHLDMVNEKNADTEHDFATDPLHPERDGDWLTARGTTLGADNGIGVAAMLAILEADHIDHGPLELLFTVDEETGLTGAAQLDASLLQGKRLINLDTEEEGAIYVGCAGGGDTRLTLPLSWDQAPPGTAALRIALRGLKGGHSGMDIQLQRGNAIRLLARILDAAAGDAALRIADFQGGNMRNAIPREAFALVTLDAGKADAFRRLAGQSFAAVRRAFAAAEPDMELGIEDADPPARAMDERSTWAVIHLLQAIPHGVEAMSHDIPGLVETSTNLARARVEGDDLAILANTRSSVASELDALRARIRAAGHLAGARVELGDAYPGWKPDLDSPLLAVTRQVFTDTFGRDPEIKAVHAGLETGIIGKKVPGMDMVSIGPEIQGPHSPDERVRIPSVATFYDALVRLIERV